MDAENGLRLDRLGVDRTAVLVDECLKRHVCSSFGVDDG
jgi:hypothetical protein